MKRFLKKELVDWKKNKTPTPLLLRGARQVGKSYLVEEFGRENFEDVVTIDFEKREEFKICFKNKDPIEIIKKLETISKSKIIPGKTLLFLDEIQKCPEALVSLRYFKEDTKNLHVIASGSLMEFILNDEKYSFPVGRIEFLYLRPVSFQEFLKEVSPIILEKLNSVTLSSTLSKVEHDEILKLVKTYFFVGGMPEAVKTFASTNSLLKTQKIHNNLSFGY